MSLALVACEPRRGSFFLAMNFGHNRFAAACTQPFDVIKTRLQTQDCFVRSGVLKFWPDLIVLAVYSCKSKGGLDSELE